MIVKMDVGDRQPELILLAGVQGDAVARLRHILADDPHTRHVIVLLHQLGEVAPPRAGIKERSQEGDSQ